jgi:hypothetical protein
MTSVEVLDELRALGIEVVRDQHRIVLRYPYGPEPPPEVVPLVERLRRDKSELLRELETADAQPGMKETRRHASR